MNCRQIERLVELQRDYDTAVDDGNLAAADQIGDEINRILEEDDPSTRCCDEKD